MGMNLHEAREAEKIAEYRHLKEGAEILLLFGDEEAASSEPNWPPWGRFYKWKEEHERMLRHPSR